LTTDIGLLHEVQSLSDDSRQLVPDAIRSAAIVFVQTPLLIVYPFIQKYFIEGVTLGAIKG